LKKYIESTPIKGLTSTS